MLFIITYDLNKPVQNYPRLWEAIKAIGGAVHGLESVWFVQSHSSATQIRDYLRQYIDSNDELFVGQVSDWAGWMNTQVLAQLKAA